jgi:hypothetical protein
VAGGRGSAQFDVDWTKNLFAVSDMQNQGEGESNTKETLLGEVVGEEDRLQTEMWGGADMLVGLFVLIKLLDI